MMVGVHGAIAAFWVLVGFIASLSRLLAAYLEHLDSRGLHGDISQRYMRFASALAYIPFRYDIMHISIVLRTDADLHPELLNNTPCLSKFVIDATNRHIQPKPHRTSDFDALLRLPQRMRW
jgi:hypothetical protein